MIIGAGAPGNVISGVLSQADDVGTILPGDLDLERAKEVALLVGSDKIKVAGGDSGLVNIMARKAVDELDEIDYIAIKDYSIIASAWPTLFTENVDINPFSPVWHRLRNRDRKRIALHRSFSTCPAEFPL